MPFSLTSRAKSFLNTVVENPTQDPKHISDVNLVKTGSDVYTIEPANNGYMYRHSYTLQKILFSLQVTPKCTYIYFR